MSKRLTTEEFIEKARKMHGDKYDYSLVEYKSTHKQVTIICPIHGEFKQTPCDHYRYNCNKCGYNASSKTSSSTTDIFIERSKSVHGDKYDYSLVSYINTRTKVKIICPTHGEFEQSPQTHINGGGCPKCAGVFDIPYGSKGITLYETYKKQLDPYGVKCRRNKKDYNLLEVKCMYCDIWYKPNLSSVSSKIRCINGKESGESNLYCSDNCKKSCPTFKKYKLSKVYKHATSREVQPDLRKLVLKRDGYQCVKCQCGIKEKQLHCHHITGVEINPIESADVDNCIILCIDCHKEAHKQKDCNMKREKC